MLRLASNQKPYDEYYSGDPAFIQPPELPVGDMPDPDLLARIVKEREEYAHKLSVARDTSNWSALLIDGETPTKFVMQPLRGDVYRTLVDLMNNGSLGKSMANHAWFRAALLQIPGLPDLQVKHAPHENPALRALGKVATVDVVNALDAIDVGIVNELALSVFQRSGNPSPK